MDFKTLIIDDILHSFNEVRYIAIYKDLELAFKQKQQVQNSSSTDSDRYEELLVNPVLLTAARQRGNIDCGGLRFLLIGYGNFYQFVKEISNGHISICLDLNTNLMQIPEQILNQLMRYSDFLLS
jgi:hypothetical protein